MSPPHKNVNTLRDLKEPPQLIFYVSNSATSYIIDMALQLSVKGLEQRRREQDADSTYRPDIKPTDAVGSQFEPFNVPDRDFLVGSSRQRYRAGNTTTPFEEHIFDNRKKQARCLACQGVQIGPRSQSVQRPRKQGPLQQLDANSINSRARQRVPKKIGTSTMWGCLTCNVAICKKPKYWCFYHRQEMPVS
ncbi:hypothetical protein EDB81DRAFT_427118 [Dactylonectria macrodidyma]|uniref:PiggyBac transposable element-derived protein domain-containing protein n=1 Tax=Dactylonectria macrodidyma TaxID=307937 RepID=A0A9P9I7D4_9HYPO|nr:hypothetical protein EDB81DRAFT_427118 [Dactylonectria macrodidyma]